MNTTTAHVHPTTTGHVHPTTTTSHHHHTTTTAHDHGGGMDHSMAGMAMTFYASDTATILFTSWATSNWGEMLGSCLFFFLLAALYEGLKVMREELLRRSTADRRMNRAAPMAGSKDQIMTYCSTEDISNQIVVRQTLGSRSHVLQSFLHVLQVSISYILMLVVMTFNIWLCLSIALGAGVGYYAFAWRRSVVVDVNEHCH